MKELKIWMVLAAVVLGAMFLAAGNAQAAHGNIDLGLLYRFDYPTWELSDFDPAHGYGIAFRYWLNDTSTLDLEVQDRILKMEMDMPHGPGKDLNLRNTDVTVGLSYIPKVDFIARPTLGFGVGYMRWEASSDLMKTTTGQGVVMYASAGLDFEINNLVSIGPMIRFQYFPFKTQLTTGEYQTSFGEVTYNHKEKTKFEQAGVVEGGLNLTFRIR